ncbi:MAG: threonine-phosphate decarboxylase CobD [Pseudomonadota bacterium]
MSRDSHMRHGGETDKFASQFPAAPTPWIDLSTGINPWPWKVPRHILDTQALLTTLPTQSDFDQARLSISKRINAEPDEVLPCPGSAMAIALLPQVIKARRVAILSPTYGDHDRAWRAAGAQVISTDDPLRYADSVDVIIICQPNNPDGRVFGTDAILAARDTLKARGGLLIVDQAYVEVAPELCLASHVSGGGLVVLRSLGKFYGLAGLRFGFLLGPPKVLKDLLTLLGDWPVSPFALKIVSELYEDDAFLAQTRDRLSQAAKRLDGIFSQADIDVVGGCDLFRFIRIPKSPGLWHHLGQAGLFVRQFEWSDTHLRIGLPPDTQAEIRLAAALKSWAVLSG